MPNGNKKNLKSLADRTTEEQREIAKKGGQASGVARLAKKHSKEAAILLASLPISEDNKADLINLGIPNTEQNNQMAMIVALYKKTLTGEPTAIKLYLEIIGEAPAQEMKINGDMKFNSGGLKQTLEALNRRE